MAKHIEIVFNAPLLAAGLFIENIRGKIFQLNYLGKKIRKALNLPILD